MVNFRIGIIGYGKMGKIRDRTIQKLGIGQVVSIYDPNESVSPRHGLEIKKSIEDVLNSSIDIVFICTPNHMIKEYTIKALNRGIHVFAEKPPGINLKETKEIIDVKIKIKKTSFGQDIEQYSNQINIISNVNVDVIQYKEVSTEYIDLIDENYILFLKIRHMINVEEEVIKINKKIQDLTTIIDKIDGKLNNKNFIERAPSEIINQNISNKTKLENDISSLKSLRQTLSD